MKTFTVGFRTGGTANFAWKRTIPFSTREEAERCAEEVRHGGRPALVFETAKLDAIGLPETFDA